MKPMSPPAPPEERTSAFRYGVPCGALLAALTTANSAIQNHRHAVGPSAQGLVVFTYLFFLIAIASIVLVGVLTARRTGRVNAGWRAGALAGAIPGAVLTIESNWVAIVRALHTGDVTMLNAVFIAMLLLAGVGGALGALVSWPGALIGRAQYREQYPLGAPVPSEIPGFTGPALTSLDMTLPQTPASFADVTINPSWPKILLFMALGLLLAGASYAYLLGAPFPSWHAVVGLVGVSLFGLTLPVGLFALIWNRPLVRFSEHGITYKGGVTLWERGQIPWEHLHSIQLTRANNTFFGKYELIIRSKHSRRKITVANWRLPRSTAQTLALVAMRYHQQIEAHDIVIRGLN